MIFSDRFTSALICCPSEARNRPRQSRLPIFLMLLSSWLSITPFPPFCSELFSQLDSGVAALKQARVQLRFYRKAVLKYAFEGQLTARWRAAQQQAGTPPPAAEILLAQIKAERQNRYQQQLAAWQKTVSQWEANGKPGRKPAKPRKLKELPPLFESDLAELPELPEGQ